MHQSHAARRKFRAATTHFLGSIRCSSHLARGSMPKPAPELPVTPPPPSQGSYAAPRLAQGPKERCAVTASATPTSLQKAVRHGGPAAHRAGTPEQRGGSAFALCGPASRLWRLHLLAHEAQVFLHE